MYSKTVLVGHLGKDPELKYTTSGKAVAKFSMATTSGFGDKKRTDWHQVTVWDKQAEAVNQYVKKGSLVLVEGELQTQSWEDKETGQKKYRTEVNASRVQFLDSKKDSDGLSDDMKKRGYGKSSAVTEDNPITDDDIPF